jgi:hypothetical protein
LTACPGRAGTGRSLSASDRLDPGRPRGATALTALSFAPWWFFLFRFLVSTGKVSNTVIAFSIGATLMVLAGLVELFLGSRPNGRAWKTSPAADRGRRRTGRSQNRLGSLKADVST